MRIRSVTHLQGDAAGEVAPLLGHVSRFRIKVLLGVAGTAQTRLTMDGTGHSIVLGALWHIDFRQIASRQPCEQLVAMTRQNIALTRADEGI